MDRSQKADLVDELKQVFTETSVVVVTRNHRSDGGAVHGPAAEDARRRRPVQSCEEQPCPDCARGHALQADRRPSEGPDRFGHVRRPRRGRQGGGRFRQDERQARDRRRSDGRHRPRRKRDQGACCASLARRTARDHRGPHPGARDQDRPHRSASRVRSWHGSSPLMGPRKPRKPQLFSSTHDKRGDCPTQGVSNG